MSEVPTESEYWRVVESAKAPPLDSGTDIALDTHASVRDVLVPGGAAQERRKRRRMATLSEERENAEGLFPSHYLLQKITEAKTAWDALPEEGHQAINNFLKTISPNTGLVRVNTEHDAALLVYENHWDRRSLDFLEIAARQLKGVPRRDVLLILEGETQMLWNLQNYPPPTAANCLHELAGQFGTMNQVRIPSAKDDRVTEELKQHPEISTIDALGYSIWTMIGSRWQMIPPENRTQQILDNMLSRCFRQHAAWGETDAVMMEAYRRINRLDGAGQDAIHKKINEIGFEIQNRLAAETLQAVRGSYDAKMFLSASGSRHLRGICEGLGIPADLPGLPENVMRGER